LSFAQFEREVTGERIRDKIAVSKKKGMWMGGLAPIGYLPHERTLVIEEPHAQLIRDIYRMYLDLGSVGALKAELDRRGRVTPLRPTRGPGAGGRRFSRGHLYRILSNAIYIGSIVHKGVPYPGQHPAIVDMDVWQAVQDQLASNVNGHRKQTTALNPSLLTGMVFDEQGTRLTPSHAKKGARRYRYYIHPVGHSGRSTPALRIPAQELEDVVLAAIAALLRDGQRVMGFMNGIGADVARGRLARAAALAQRLTDVAADRIELLGRLVARISIAASSIEIVVRIPAIWSDDDGPIDDEPVTSITVPVQLKRSGLAVRLIVRAPWAVKARAPDLRLVALLAKAQRWFASLSSGHVDSVLTIAQEHGLASRDVTRVIYLAFLAPDIVQRIARGEQPIDWNVKTLLAMAPLPLDWRAQRRLFGFDG
jgi:hypothetical protein